MLHIFQKFQGYLLCFIFKDATSSVNVTPGVLTFMVMVTKCVEQYQLKGPLI